MSSESPASKSLDVSDFRLSQASCEVRYENAYLHWDRAGAIWHDMVAQQPGLKMAHAEPGKTTFRLDHRFEFNIALDRLWLVARNPQASLAEFAEQFDRFAGVAREHLKIVEFSRVGLRHIFVRSYDDKESASGVFLGFGLVKAPQPCFGISNTPIFPSYSLRWEDEKKGCAVNFRIEEHKFQLELPFGWDGEIPPDKVEMKMTFDIDYYSMGRIGIEQIRFTDWIKQAVHIVRRDSVVFLESK